MTIFQVFGDEEENSSASDEDDNQSTYYFVEVTVIWGKKGWNTGRGRKNEYYYSILQVQFSFVNPLTSSFNKVNATVVKKFCTLNRLILVKHLVEATSLGLREKITEFHEVG